MITLSNGSRSGLFGVGLMPITLSANRAPTCGAARPTPDFFVSFVYRISAISSCVSGSNISSTVSCGIVSRSIGLPARVIFSTSLTMSCLSCNFASLQATLYFVPLHLRSQIFLQDISLPFYRAFVQLPAGCRSYFYLQIQLRK